MKKITILLIALTLLAGCGVDTSGLLPPAPYENERVYIDNSPGPLPVPPAEE